MRNRDNASSTEKRTDFLSASGLKRIMEEALSSKSDILSFNLRVDGESVLFSIENRYDMYWEGSITAPGEEATGWSANRFLLFWENEDYDRNSDFVAETEDELKKKLISLTDAMYPPTGINNQP